MKALSARAGTSGTEKPHLSVIFIRCPERRSKEMATDLTDLVAAVVALMTAITALIQALAAIANPPTPAP